MLFNHYPFLKTYPYPCFTIRTVMDGLRCWIDSTRLCAPLRPVIHGTNTCHAQKQPVKNRRNVRDSYYCENYLFHVRSIDPKYQNINSVIKRGLVLHNTTILYKFTILINSGAFRKAHLMRTKRVHLGVNLDSRPKKKQYYFSSKFWVPNFNPIIWGFGTS